MVTLSSYAAQVLADLVEPLTFAFIGMIGSLMNLALLNKHATFTGAVRNMFIGAFCGFIAGDACAYLDVPAKAATAAAGIAGFCGGFGILLLVSGVAKRLGVNTADIKADLEALQGSNSMTYIDITERWLNTGVITPEVFGRMAGGHLSELNTLLEYGKISADEYERVRRWIIKRKQDTRIPEADPIVTPTKENRKSMGDTNGN